MAVEREPRLPSYERPPVHEVAIGIGFSSLDCWGATAAGEFWSLIRDQYPKVEDKSILAPLPIGRAPEAQLGISELPPIRRVWFVSEDESTLIQVQSDRLHVNWRRTSEYAAYPRYGHVLDQFEFALASLMGFSAERGEQLRVQAGEVTYVNHIPQSHLWTSWNDLSNIFGDWHVAPRNVGIPDAVSSVISYNGDQEGVSFVSPGHHMTIEVKSALRATDSSKVIVLQLVNRGRLESESFEDIAAWLGVASADIVKGFTEVTAPAAHEFWGRKQ